MDLLKVWSVSGGLPLRFPSLRHNPRRPYWLAGV